MNKKRNSVNDIVKVGIFAAITFLGIQIFRIPLPAAIGTPFVHFGHIFVVFGVFLLGGKLGAISGTLGLVIFDLVNGYLHAMPQVFVETIIKCLILGMIFDLLKEQMKNQKSGELTAAVISAAIYGMMGILIEFVMGTIMMIVAGSKFIPALIGSLTSIPATVINAVFMVIVIALLYKPVKRIYARV